MILSHLKQFGADVALLQEMHLEAKDFPHLHYSWVGGVYGSSAQAHKAGVITLLHKGLNCEVIHQQSDADGRWLQLILKIGDQTISFHNVYGSNADSRDFFQRLKARMHSDSTVSRIVGGDLNVVVNNTEDQRGPTGRLGGPRTHSSPLMSFLPNCQLLDSWRTLHPDGREFTHYSHPHNSWSRIDCLLISQTMLQRVDLVLIGDMVISDHAPVILQLTDVLPRGIHYLWRFPTHLSSDEEFQAVLRGWWLEYTATPVEHANTPGLYWETAKAVLRGHIMSYMNKLKRQVNDKILTLSQTLRCAYTLFQENTSTQRRSNGTKPKTIMTCGCKRGRVPTAQDARLFRYGSKAGKLLAIHAKGICPMSHITTLKDMRGTTHHDPSKINDILRDFYKDIYTGGGPMGGDPGKWLDNAALPTLTDEERGGALGSPITQEEMEGANLKPHKAPGPDGYIAEFFYIFKSDISLFLTQLFNSFLQGAPIPQYMNMAYIKVLPKPGKDLLLPAS